MTMAENEQRKNVNAIYVVKHCERGMYIAERACVCLYVNVVFASVVESYRAMIDTIQHLFMIIRKRRAHTWKHNRNSHKDTRERAFNEIYNKIFIGTDR